MKRENLIGRIIPIRIGNTDELRNSEEKFDTIDLIYLPSYEEQYSGEETDEERRISATDYAQMNNAFIYERYQARNNKKTTWAWLRSVYSKYMGICINGDGGWESNTITYQDAGLRPALRYIIPTEEELSISEVKDARGEIIYHTIQIGEYPKTVVDEKLEGTLEQLYNGGMLRKGILNTGRWYSGNGQKENGTGYAGKHSPEFEYNGERYVRVVSYPQRDDIRYSNGTISGEIGTVRWVKVEPISFIIRNWDEMPKHINPNGNGEARYFSLITEEAIVSNIPFYPHREDENSAMWQNSTIRGFLNGIDVRNISQNGAIEYGAARGGNFTGECNFLNEAFNLSRQPIIEYAIPECETQIPDDAFNGCTKVKRIIIHEGVTKIGKRAFDGLRFKFAYRAKTGELVLAEELPKDKEEPVGVVEFDKLRKIFGNFEYDILLETDKLNELLNLLEFLKKNKFRIPYAYAMALVESGNVQNFCNNSDIRFFRNEIPNINDMLLEFPEEEQIAFFKFATALGCFSKRKLLDKNDEETQICLAQKSTSLIARLIKTEGMRLRTVQQIICRSAN